MKVREEGMKVHEETVQVYIFPKPELINKCQ